MNKIAQHLMQLDEALTLADLEEIEKAVQIIREVKNLGGTVWLAGNGGSATTASHFANDLNKMTRVRAVSIPDQTSIVTAYGNDDGWEKMYSYTLSDHVAMHDVVIGISCSGNSANILTYMAIAKHCKKIALTGPGVNKLSEMKPDVLIRVMSDEITVIEDGHLIICHAIARSLCHV